MFRNVFKEQSYASYLKTEVITLLYDVRFPSSFQLHQTPPNNSTHTFTPTDSLHFRGFTDHPAASVASGPSRGPDLNCGRHTLQVFTTWRNKAMLRRQLWNHRELQSVFHLLVEAHHPLHIRPLNPANRSWTRETKLTATLHSASCYTANEPTSRQRNRALRGLVSRGLSHSWISNME